MLKRVKALYEDIHQSTQGEKEEDLFLVGNYLYLVADYCMSQVKSDGEIFPQERKPTLALNQEELKCPGLYWLEAPPEKKKRGRPSSAKCEKNHERKYKGPAAPERLYICQSCYKKMKNA